MVTALNLEYEFDTKSNRFRYTEGASKGKFLSREASLNIVNRGISEAKDQMLKEVNRLYSGQIEPDVFIIREADLLKKIHIYQGVLGAGGSDKLTDKHIKIINEQLKEQLTKGKDDETGNRFGLKFLLRDILKGESKESILNRIGMYADSGNLTKNRIEFEIKKDSGVTEARRKLGANDAHCQGCLVASDYKWKSLSDIVLIGDCECRGRCRCTIEYR